MNELAAKRRAGRPRAKESEQKRQGLIVTALEEFARVGFHAASLREIADKAQLSSRTLYNYYPDKLTLFEACLEYSGRQIHPELPDLHGDLRAQLVIYTTEMQRQLSAPLNLHIARLIYREGSDFDGLRQIARLQFERHQVMPVADILHNEGITADMCHIFATQFVAMAFGEWQRRLLFGGEPMTETEMTAHAELVATMFLEGINAQR